MFLVFRADMTQNPPFPDFAIFEDEARLGDFRGPSQPVNDWVREPECIRKMPPEKIAHSSDDAIFQAFPEMQHRTSLSKRYRYLPQRSPMFFVENKA